MLVDLFNLEMPNPKEIDKAFNDKFVSKEKFAADIEQLVLHTQMNYIDAIVQYCEDKGIEIESVGSLVTNLGDVYPCTGEMSDFCPLPGSGVNIFECLFY